MKVCPLTTRWSAFELQGTSTGILATNSPEVDPELGRLIHITTHALADEEPYYHEDPNHENHEKTLVGGLNDMSGPWNWNTEAFKVHKIWTTGSPLPSTMWFKIKEAEKNTWYRYSLCVGKGNVQDFNFEHF